LPLSARISLQNETFSSLTQVHVSYIDDDTFSWSF
jgi:hypothetical protein